MPYPATENRAEQVGAFKDDFVFNIPALLIEGSLSTNVFAAFSIKSEIWVHEVLPASAIKRIGCAHLSQIPSEVAS